MSYYSSSIMQAVSKSMYKVFGWMSLGLFLTSTIAYSLFNSPYLFMFFNAPAIWIVALSSIAIIFGISFFYTKMNYSTIVSLYLLYTALNGITLSTIFMIYTLNSIIGVFFIAAGIFMCMSIYGYVTKEDLSPIGSFATMMLFGLLITGIINIFIKSYFLDMTKAFIGVLVFSAFTAFDMQSLKNYMAQVCYNQSERNKVSILGAINMYLNFINLFLNLLRLLGKKKDN